jgi:thiol-disulfide isomerase/thioredoxin
MAFRSYRAPSFNFLQYRGNGGARVLQRRCACGNRAESNGECSQCAESEGLLQRKARSGRPQEAPAIVHDALSAPGKSLDNESQQFMEARFGYDFSGVRIHADEQAHRSAEATNAEAYTVGQDIVFASGRYAPGTPAGRQLLAHELTHVVQQDSAPSSGPITMGQTDDYEANADQAAADVVSGKKSAAAIHSRGAGLQRQQATGGAKTPAPATAKSCLEEVAGEDIPSLLQSGVLTIIEFGAKWCNPCQDLKYDLDEICKDFQKKPPPAPVRFYSIDIEATGNDKASAPYIGGGVPHLYFYVGATERAHFSSAPPFEVLKARVQKEVDYAATSGATRGALAGLGWGALAGGVTAGVVGGALLGTQTNLKNEGLAGAIFGTIAAGSAIGLGIGAAVGAGVGAATDARKTGPKQQERKKLQPKSRNGESDDPKEREADLWAARVVHSDSRSLDPSTRGSMERQFDYDFSHVRIHRDHPAQDLTREMNAYAVTRGSDIYFAADGYAPDTPFGRAVLHHELAHVVQNESSNPHGGVSVLESEAATATSEIATGRQPMIEHGSNHPALALTRGEKTAAGAATGAASGAGLGVAIGLIAASKFAGKDKPYGEGAGIGAAIGGVAGLIGGLLYGYFDRNTTPETTAEAEALIQRKYGKYLRGGASGPLHNATVHVVNHARLCERFACRHGQPVDPDCPYSGWTDTGVPIKPTEAPKNQQPPITDPANEPTCKGERMEHATPESPVIYYERESKYAGTLIHEGLHAHSHPDFAYLHNHLTEGVTDYFARQLQDEINMPHPSGYKDEVKSAEKLIKLVGEETVAQAYFNGAIPQLHEAVNSKLGPCALAAWAFFLQMESYTRADTVMEGRNQDYCHIPWPWSDRTPADMTPSMPAESQTQQQEQSKTEQSR